MRHTEETLRTKDVTEDILTLIFAKDFFKSGRMKEEMQKISSGIAYTTSAVILGHYVEFLTNYATYLGKKLEELGRGFLNLEVDWLTENILPKYELNAMYAKVNSKLEKLGYKIGCTLEDCYSYK